MRKTVLTGILSFIVALAFIAASAPDAEAKKKPKRKPKPAAERMFYLDLGLNIAYDDNVINYSDSDLEVFSSDSLTGKFAIDSKDDWIITPRIHPRLKTKFIGGNDASLELGFDYAAFVQNDVKRYSKFSLTGRQYFSKKLYGQISYYYIPEYYYRNYMTISGDTSSFAEANFSKNSIGIEIGYEIISDLRASAQYIYQHKTFNSDFDFRDSDLNGVDLEANYRLKLPFRVWAIYGFESSKAKGADMDESYIDASYDAWDITFGGRYYSSILPKYKPEVFVSFQNRMIKYQTDRLNDIFRLGREDHNILLRFGHILADAI